MGVMVIRPEFVFKVIGLAALLGIIVGFLEEYRSWNNKVCA